MNSTTGRLFASLVISAACLGGGPAEAAPAASHEWGTGAGRERHERFEMQNIVPEWARANENGPAIANGFGYGYYSRGLGDEKSKDKVHEENDPNEKEPKKDKNGNEGPGSQGPKEKPDKPEPPRGNGQGPGEPSEEPPLLPEPIDYPHQPPTGIPGGEIPEPASATLLGIAIVGWLTSAASRRPR
jgi:hypothetical protein